MHGNYSDRDATTKTFAVKTNIANDITDNFVEKIRVTRLDPFIFLFFLLFHFFIRPLSTYISSRVNATVITSMLCTRKPSKRFRTCIFDIDRSLSPRMFRRSFACIWQRVSFTANIFQSLLLDTYSTPDNRRHYPPKKLSNSNFLLEDNSNRHLSKFYQKHSKRQGKKEGITNIVLTSTKRVYLVPRHCFHVI